LKEGVVASSFKKGTQIFMDPQDLLSIEIFTNKKKMPPKGPRGVAGRGGNFLTFDLESYLSREIIFI